MLEASKGGRESPQDWQDKAAQEQKRAKEAVEAFNIVQAKAEQEQKRAKEAEEEQEGI